MGVVSNKINIMELQKSGGGGDPTIPGRVSALENEMTGVYASINQISTVELPKVYSSINEISTVELPKVYSSISAVSDLILTPVTGLNDRVEVLEDYTEYEQIYIDNTSATKTNAEVFTELHTALSALAAHHTSILMANITLYIDNDYYTFRGERLCKIGDGNGDLLSNVYIYAVPEITSGSNNSMSIRSLCINIKKTNTGQYAYIATWGHYIDGSTPDTFVRKYAEQTDTTNIIKVISFNYRFTNV